MKRPTPQKGNGLGAEHDQPAKETTNKPLDFNATAGIFRANEAENSTGTTLFPQTDCAWSPLAGLRRMATTRWLIDGLLQQDSTALVFGAPGSFKSFMTMDMAVAIASGQPWQGRATEQAIVVYLAAEGGDAIHLRRAGAQIARGITNKPIPLALVQMRPRLDEPIGAKLLSILVGRATNKHLCHEYISAEDFLSEEVREKLEAKHTDQHGELNMRALNPELERLGLLEMNSTQKADYLAVDAAYKALSPCKLDGARDYHHWEGIHNVLLIVDTFAQVASDDTKAVFSRYTQTIRDLQDIATKAGLRLSVLTIDHATKSGDSYMGSLSKEGNVDTLMMVERAGGSMSMKLACHKQKDAPDFEPVALDMAPVMIEGFADGYGRPLQTLRVTDGTHSARLRRAVGAGSDTAAARVLDLLTGSPPLHLEELKSRFMALPDEKEKKGASVKRTFSRAIDSLVKDCLIELSETDLVRAIN